MKNNVYIGRRYVPKIVGNWDNTGQTAYESLTIVQWAACSYTSKKDVPVGIDINNSEYWVCTGNYNAQVEQYRQETLQVKQEVVLKQNINDTALITENKNIVGAINENKTILDSIVHVNALSIGCDNTGVNDITPILQEKISNNMVIKFPKGNYLIGSKLTIENISNLKFITNGDVNFIDKGKNIILEDGTMATTPCGIKFNNITDLEIDGISFISNNTAEISVGHRIPLEQEINRSPMVEFTNCKILNLDKIKLYGNVGSAIARGIDGGIDNYLNQFYIKITNSRMININNIEIMSECGGGETIGIYQSTNININNVNHFQNTSATIIWSLFKLINVNTVIANNILVQSTSNASLIDVCGQNIEIQNVTCDYPNGKVIDFTLEWGDGNVDSDNITIKNVISNGSILSSAFKSNLKKQSNINIINVKSTQAIDRKRFITNTNLLAKYEIKDSAIQNVSDFNTNFIATMDEVFVINKCLVSNCDFIVDKAIYQNVIACETLGELVINNSTFTNEVLCGVSFVDRLGLLSSDTTQYGSIEINDCTFNNMEIKIKSNITFNNCKFNNCSFDNTYNGNKQRNETSFNTCEFKYSTTIENPFVVTGNTKQLYFTDCKFIGVITKTKNCLFDNIEGYKYTMTFNNCLFDVYLNSVTPLYVLNIELQNFNSLTLFRNCVYTQRCKTVYFNCDTLIPFVSGSNIISFIGCYVQRFDSYDGNGSLATGVTGTRVRLGVTGNTFISGTVTRINALLGLNRIVVDGNVEI